MYIYNVFCLQTLNSLFHESSTRTLTFNVESAAASLITSSYRRLAVVCRTHVAAKCQGGPCKVKAWNSDVHRWDWICSLQPTPRHTLKVMSWARDRVQISFWFQNSTLADWRCLLLRIETKDISILPVFSNPSCRIIRVHIQTQVFSGCVANDEGMMWIKLWSLWSQHSGLRCLGSQKTSKNPGNENCSSTKKKSSSPGEESVKAAVLHKLDQHKSKCSLSLHCYFVLVAAWVIYFNSTIFYLDQK